MLVGKQTPQLRALMAITVLTNRSKKSSINSGSCQKLFLCTELNDLALRY